MKNSSKTPTFVDQNKIYHMKRTLLLIFTLLTVTLAAVAQPRISSNKETHNFGQIEWKKPVTVEYTITNTGNEPLVLTNVTTSCACAVADWTKEPIAPGAKGTVKASFDAKALGRFDKSIGIYSNATPNLVYLKFTGEVVQEIKDYSKLLPYAIGNIRIDRDEFSFPDVYRGQQPSMTFSIANLSDRPYEPVLMHLPPYLKMEAEPKVLLKGKKGTIKLTLDASQLQDFGLTQSPADTASPAWPEWRSHREWPGTARRRGTGGCRRWPGRRTNPAPRQSGPGAPPGSPADHISRSSR